MGYRLRHASARPVEALPPQPVAHVLYRLTADDPAALVPAGSVCVHDGAGWISLTHRAWDLGTLDRGVPLCLVPGVRYTASLPAGAWATADWAGLTAAAEGDCSIEVDAGAADSVALPPAGHLVEGSVAAWDWTAAGRALVTRRRAGARTLWRVRVLEEIVRDWAAEVAMLWRVQDGQFLDITGHTACAGPFTVVGDHIVLPASGTHWLDTPLAISQDLPRIKAKGLWVRLCPAANASDGMLQIYYVDNYTYTGASWGMFGSSTMFGSNEAYLENSEGTPERSFQFAGSTGPGMSPGQWHHVASINRIVDGGMYMETYVDGIALPTAKQSPAANALGMVKAVTSIAGVGTAVPGAMGTEVTGVFVLLGNAALEDVIALANATRPEGAAAL